jgi:hypothetical protein
MIPQNEWIESVLNSVENIESAKLNNDFFYKIQNRIESEKQLVLPFSPRISLAIAASLVLLFGVNIFTFISITQSSSKTLSNNTVVQEYFNYSETIKI